MKTNILEKQDLITKLLRKGEYFKAYSFLKETKWNIKRSSNLEKAEYYFIYAWYYWGIGEYKKAYHRIKSSLKLSEETNDLSTMAKYKQLLGAILEALGNLTDAVEAYNEAYTIRKISGEKTKLYGILNNLALNHFLKGDLHIALTVADKALKYAIKYNGSNKIRICKFNKSRILIFLGEFQEAIKIIQEYENTYDLSDPDKAFIEESYGIIDTFLLYKEEAVIRLNEALKLYKKQEMKREQVICLEYLGLNEYLGINEYLAGNYIKAKEYFDKILEHGDKQLAASAKAQTLRLLTDVLVAEGNIVEAIQTAKKARRAIKNVSEKIELGALHRAYGQIYTHKGNNKKAHFYFKKSINILEATGARYEKGLTLLTMGRSKSYSIEDQQRHLKNAKELFEDMGVEKRVEEISRTLKKLQVKQETQVLPIKPELSNKTGIIDSLIGFPLLIILIVVCLLSITMLKGTYVGFSIFIGSGILAYEIINMMSSSKKKEKNQAKS